MVTPHIQTHMLVALTKTVQLFLMDVWAPSSLSPSNASEQRGISEALVARVELGLSRAVLNHRGAIASLTVRVDADESHCPESPATNPSTQQADPLDLVFIKHGGSLLSNYDIYLASGVIDRCKVPLHRLAEAHLEACAHAHASAVLQAHQRAQVAAMHANSMGCCHRHPPPPPPPPSWCARSSPTRDLVIHAAGSSEQQPRLTNGEGQFEQQRLLEGSTLGRIGQCGATALLIEPRKQPMAMLAMATVAQNMPNVTCFLVYHGPGNLEWLRNQPIVSHLLALGRLNLRPLPEYAAPLRSESDHESRPLEPGLRREWDSVLPQTLFMRYDFWAGLPTETVLNFQSDSVLCRPLDLSRWASFAQVGAPWRALKCNQTRVLWHRMSGGRAPATPWRCPDDGRVGNSGLSIRNRAWMMRAIAACPSDLAGPLPPGGARRCACRAGCVEDVYIASTLRGLGAPLPSVREAAEFAGEQFVQPGTRDGGPRPAVRMPIGLHGLHRRLDAETWGCRRLRAMQRQCPPMRTIFGDVASRACDEEVARTTGKRPG